MSRFLDLVSLENTYMCACMGMEFLSTTQWKASFFRILQACDISYCSGTTSLCGLDQNYLLSVNIDASQKTNFKIKFRSGVIEISGLSPAGHQEFETSMPIEVRQAASETPNGEAMQHTRCWPLHQQRISRDLRTLAGG